MMTLEDIICTIRFHIKEILKIRKIPICSITMFLTLMFFNLIIYRYGLHLRNISSDDMTYAT